MLSTFFQRAFGAPSRLLLCASLAVGLVACGGGGGSPGKVPGAPTNPTTVKPASVTLVASSPTMTSTGVDGTEVSLTAIVKDANNNALPGAVVNFSADSGSISNTVRIADANGSVTEKLNTKGNSTPRDIKITASTGGITSNEVLVTVVTTLGTKPHLLLTSSSGTLASAGLIGSEVSIRALLLDPNNVVVQGATVTFAADSGSLNASQKVTDATGLASVLLSTGTDPTSRVITVTANIAGQATPEVLKISVTGSKLVINAAATVNKGAKVDVTAVLTDSAGAPLGNRPITFSATTNSLTTSTGGGSPAVTDALGKLVMSYTGTTATALDTITVSSMGETATAPVTVIASNFTVGAVDAARVPLTQVNTNVCTRVLVHNFNSNNAPLDGTVTVNTSRGAMYSDAACGVLLTGPIATVPGTGEIIVYVIANSPGVSTFNASSSVSGSNVQGTVEFVAPLVAGSVITMQASPAIIPAGGQSILRAVVLDKDTQGNPVKDAIVVFSIVSDPSGGTLSQPTQVKTAADGSATVNYIAGATATAVDGVVIQARVQSPVVVTPVTTKLTVAARSLFISAGTGNTITILSNTLYQIDYSVFVTDAAGNAVSGADVTAAVRPRNYYKGQLFWVDPVWTRIAPSATCLNEDVDSDGHLGPFEDKNGNGVLDPVIPMNITSSGKTSVNGTATVSLTYPKDRAYWLDVDFTIRGAVSGSEARYLGYQLLKGAATEYNQQAIAPPGQFSPYGTSNSCSNTN